MLNSELRSFAQMLKKAMIQRKFKVCAVTALPLTMNFRLPCLECLVATHIIQFGVHSLSLFFSLLPSTDVLRSKVMAEKLSHWGESVEIHQNG